MSGKLLPIPLICALRLRGGNLAVKALALLVSPHVPPPPRESEFPRAHGGPSRM